MLFNKSIFAVAILALANVVTATTQTPACVLKIIGDQPNPADSKTICGSSASKIQSEISKSCPNSDASLKFFASNCAQLGHKVAASTTTAATGTATGTATATATGTSGSSTATGFVTAVSSGSSTATGSSASATGTSSSASGSAGSSTGSSTSGAASSPTSTFNAASSDRQFSATTFVAAFFIGAAALL
ncbi:hypothetical protein N7457_002265 [Penicillium paradoxum]|uniref:uncharacterized protein n=1 Tax=Penicillium paradoxum TaxID=176176 RepID=UPI0025496A7A|nr:uncharacterized protein N7457_002265 [Penicillium paradoxum]KAJ5787275.1 hypothetical protein N7457_002265 [Penicillium paradoxum]